MAAETIGIIVNGATGRIASTQHLANALVPIRDEGGLVVGDRHAMPRLLLVGRNAERLAAIARTHGIPDWTTDLGAALADPAYAIFFDAASTPQRAGVLGKAIAAGKHIYSEKPVATTVTDGLALLKAARARGVKHGAVEDKLELPGFDKLARLAASRFLRPRGRLPHRVRLVGVRRHRRAGPAAELELQAQGGRRAHPRHVSALALRDREHARTACGAW